MSAFDVDAARASLEARHRVWTPRTLSATLQRAAAEHPDRPAVITDAGEVSYAQLPLTPSGKVQKFVLARRASEQLGG